jgi:magnesium transporter
LAAAVTVHWLEHGKVRSGGVESLATARETGCAWVDVLEPDQESLAKVASVYDLHPLAVEDCLHYPQRPKLDAYDGTLFLIWLTPTTVVGDGVSTQEVDAFLTHDALITVHREPSAAIDHVAEEPQAYLERGTDWTLHTIIDRLTDDLFPLIDGIGDRLEELEDIMVEDGSREHLASLHDARRALLTLHKAVGPERDVLRELARERDLVSADAYHYFVDVGDHLARAEDALETYREVAASVMDIYLSSVSNRMNVIMKQLSWRYGYFGVLGLMASIVVAMLVVFKRRGWW